MTHPVEGGLVNLSVKSNQSFLLMYLQHRRKKYWGGIGVSWYFTMAYMPWIILRTYDDLKVS